MAQSSCEPANLVPRVFFPNNASSNKRATREGCVMFTSLIGCFNNTNERKQSKILTWCWTLSMRRANGSPMFSLSRFQRPRSFWSAPRVAILGAYQKERGFWGRHYGRGLWICVRSNDTQKRVTQTSLIRGKMWNIFSRVLLPESSAFCSKKVKHLWNWGAANFTATWGQRRGSVR